ncbi:GntR family transcriptional regulator [Temperatibacter marinus]|uniref:GntR family transcriptional regulator n=1 Tax=Temperatibacter marinus TaxID=1456591 RepID=A0AA52EHD6_9PROT|nr:GntR family transcriptional regulator [Temperatibacter marinus]WND02815.1 GntR family transcriptional regulator [Temperatibacter marinus]
MKPEWTDDQPIYRQLRDKVAAAIVEGAIGEGENLPSVRNIAVEMQINPITASKAYQELVMEGLIEKKRGLGMYVVDGAREKLLVNEQEKFIKEEWPRIVETISRLGLDVKVLLDGANAKRGH